MIKKVLFVSLICLFVFSLGGCMYLMEEDPWKWQKKVDERERIRKEQEMNKQQAIEGATVSQANK
jgi:hypothetical protein